VVQVPLRRRGLILEYITLGWNVVGVVIVVVAAYMARSVALAGFGLDSLIAHLGFRHYRVATTRGESAT
jgi:hypothetical protein